MVGSLAGGGGTERGKGAGGVETGESSEEKAVVVVCVRL